MARSGKPWLAALLAVSAVLAASGFGGAQPAASGGWAKAHFLGGVVKPGLAMVTMIKCSSPGNCAASGTFSGARSELFVISQVKGQWARPVLIPGTIRSSKPGASPGGVACFSAGNCVLVGTYTDAAGQAQAFIMSQKNGTWHKVFWVPGLANLDRGHSAGLSYLACPSAGNCAAVGSYTDASHVSRPFVVTEVHGSWRLARPVPHLSGLPGQLPGETLGFGTISCASPGNCSAGGSYGISGGSTGFVDDEVNGVWGKPETVPGLAALNVGLAAAVTAISCSAPGDCGAGGNYNETEGNSNSFVINESNGHWGPAAGVTSAIPFFDGPDGDFLASISCPSDGNCVAGGTDQVEHDALAAEVYIVTETHGQWSKAIALPGSTQLNQGDQGSLSQIDCSSAGNCGVAGAYSAEQDFGFQYTQPFVATEAHGKWSKAIGVPGIKVQPVNGTGQVGATNAISCTAPDRCSAGGWISSDGLNHNHAFVDSQP
jgi:hypothetical protein